MGVQEEGEVDERPPHQIRLQNDLRSSMKLEEQLSNLKPCTKYQVTLDLYLNEDNAEDSNEVDYMRQNFTFHTMPTKESLNKATMESQAKMDNFSQILPRSGFGNADEPKTSANTAADPESAAKSEPAAEAEPSTKSSGNLNSFVSLSLFLATFIIKSF